VGLDPPLSLASDKGSLSSTTVLQTVRINSELITCLFGCNKPLQKAFSSYCFPTAIVLSLAGQCHCGHGGHAYMW
jgi:hypothetical protein